MRSAVEQALFDLRARRAGLAIGAFLAPSPRLCIPAYANINRSVVERTPAGFAAAARRALAAGYRAFKLAPFDGVIAADAATTPIDARIRAGLDRVFAVRDALGAAPALMRSSPSVDFDLVKHRFGLEVLPPTPSARKPSPKSRSPL